MFVELIATFVAGIAGAGLMMLILRVTGNRLPRWLVPVTAGLAMLAATITSEYGWYDRTIETMPEGFSVVQTVENRAVYRPWTYVVPFVERFVALDATSLQTNSSLPDQRLADVYFYGRWSPLNRLTVVADCVQGRRAALVDNVAFTDTGALEGVDWVSVSDDDPLLIAICEI
ncbi:hypothetical protein BXY66_1114 [Shimia isoporae]|uniref:Uncharacterized protein n=1 Tax=Shimia isoporae TaxID=647720 RepID=A0A4R1NMU1_9RHOB|nr:hypothetical protein [Shimia isoporae]TCL09071.1 hypothetical protein BXY66_1114 [Shimia isoporae]